MDVEAETPFDAEGIYASVGEQMPAHEIRAFWARVFAEAAYAREEVDDLTMNPELAPQMFPSAPPHGPVMVPFEDDIPDLPHRPVEFQRPADEEVPDQTAEQIARDREAAQQQAFVLQVAQAVTASGTVWTTRALRKQGYTPPEVNQIMRKARRALHERFESTDIEEDRALSAARYEDIYRKSGDASDYRTQVRAQSRWDVIKGLVQEEGLGPMQEFARLTRQITAKDPAIFKVIEATAEVRVLEEVDA